MANQDQDRDSRSDRQAGEQHPGVGGEEVRVPERPEQPRRDRPPIGNGGTDEPAAFPPHN